jgi:glycosyltransferase involved in cell wall biosynthesis
MQKSVSKAITGQDKPTGNKSIILCGNTAWGMLNFRRDLIAALLAHGHSVTVLAPAAPESVQLEALGATFVPVSIQSKGTNPLVELRCARRIHSVLKSLRPDIVLPFTIKSVIYCGIACRLLGIACVPTITGMGSAFITKSWITHVAVALYKLACARADTVFFLNQSDRDFFVDAGIVKDNRAKIIPGEGIDIEHFSPPRRAVARSTRNFRFLYCGRILAEKGFLELIEATRQLRRTGLPFETHVVGFADWDNPSAIRKQQLIEWESEGLIVFHGPSTDVRPFIGDADCIVLPSYREGLSRILLEAAAMECPMIASNVPGCREIVRDGFTGFTFEPRSSRSLADCMARVVRMHPDHVKRLGANARKLVLEEYSSERVASKYLSLF